MVPESKRVEKGLVDAAQIEEWILCRLSAVLEIPRQSFGTGTRWDATGLDSLSEAGLAMELEHAFGVAVNSLVLSEHTTIGEVARYIAATVDRN